MSARVELGALIAERMPTARVYDYPVDPDQVLAGGAIVVTPTTIELASVDGRRTARTFDVYLLVAGDDPAHAEDELDDLVSAFIVAARSGGPGLTIGPLTRGTYQDTYAAYSTPLTIQHEETTA